MRERDARRAAGELLMDTGEFHCVAVGGELFASGVAASDLCFALIEPQDSQESDEHDAGPWGASIIKARASLIVGARRHDPILRDSEAERLLNVARNALNGKSLGGFTMPDFTKVSRWAWQRPADVERRIACTLAFTYLEEGWDAADVSD